MLLQLTRKKSIKMTPIYMLPLFTLKYAHHCLHTCIIIIEIIILIAHPQNVILIMILLWVGCVQAIKYKKSPSDFLWFASNCYISFWQTKIE